MEKREKVIGSGKLRAWLKEDGKHLAGKVLQIGGDLTGQDWVKAVGDRLVDDPDVSREDTATIIELRDFDLREMALVNADMADARNMTVEVQKTKEASWLAKNTPYILDIFVVSTLAVMIFLYAFIELDETQKELAALGMGIFGTLSTQVFHFHRGSSQGSKDKSDLLNKK